jgi:hypothetical protein
MKSNLMTVGLRINDEDDFHEEIKSKGRSILESNDVDYLFVKEKNVITKQDGIFRGEVRACRSGDVFPSSVPVVVFWGGSAGTIGVVCFFMGGAGFPSW